MNTRHLLLKINTSLLSLISLGIVAAASSPAAATTDLPTAIVSYQTIPREQWLDGIVEAVNQATVSAQTTGRVVEVMVDVDDFVQADAVIVRLSGTEQAAGVDQAEANVSNARARYDEALQQHQRIKGLLANQLVAQAELDNAKANLNSTRAALDSAQAALVRAQEQAGYTVVRAPYSGIVNQRHVEVGEMVNPGQPLMTGFSLNQLRVRVEVPQRLISDVRGQQNARVQLPGPEKQSIAAEGMTIFPYANQGANTIPVRVNLPEGAEGLFPGMMVKVAFKLGERLGLMVPKSAIVYRSEVVGVYTIDEQGNVGLRHIRTGNQYDQGLVEVLAGLDDGEQVSLDPVAAVSQLHRQMETQQEKE